MKFKTLVAGAVLVAASFGVQAANTNDDQSLLDFQAKRDALAAERLGRNNDSSRTANTASAVLDAPIETDDSPASAADDASSHPRR